jgi:hypothetical protein
MRYVAFNQYMEYAPQFSKYWSVQGTTDPFNNYTGVSPLGVPDVVDERDPIPLDRPQQLYDKKLQPLKYGLGVELSRETMDDDKFGIFTQMGTLLAKAFRYSDEILAADVADNSHLTTSSSYTSADGSAIHSTTHPIDGGAATASNRLATNADLSMSSLNTLQRLMEETPDDRGNLTMVIANELVVPTELRHIAATLIRSSDDPDTTDRSVSPLVDDSLSYSVWRHLTDPDAFFLWSDMTPGVGWTWLVRQAFDLDDDINIRNQTSIVVATDRKDFGVMEWRGTAKSTGGGS